MHFIYIWNGQPSLSQYQYCLTSYIFTTHSLARMALTHKRYMAADKRMVPDATIPCLMHKRRTTYES